MKASRRSFERTEDGVAGVVAGMLMVAGLIAFLAYFQVSWVPTWVANKETVHASEFSAAMAGFADVAEDHVSRSATGESFSRTIPLGVTGLPVLGTGASTGELAVASGPALTVSVGGTTVLTATGALVASTHTLQFPPQTYTYTLGGMEVAQADGAWVDLRNLVTVSRASGGALSLTVEGVSVTGAPQSVGGNGNVQTIGSVTSVERSTGAAGNVRFQLTGVSANAWREAFQRVLDTAGLLEQDSAGCATFTTGQYCFSTTGGANTATAVDLTLSNVATGWTAVLGSLAAQARSA